MSATTGNVKNESMPDMLIGRHDLIEKFRNGKIPTEKDFELLIDSMVNQVDDGYIKDDRYGFIFIPPGSTNKMLSFRREINAKDIFFSLETDDKKSAPGNEQSKETIEGMSDPETKPVVQDEYLRLNPNPDGKSSTSLNGGFYFYKNGNLAIGKPELELEQPMNPNHKLEVNGFMATTGRIGSFQAYDNPLPDPPPPLHPGLWQRVWNYFFGLKKESDQEKVSRKPGQAPADGRWHMIIGGLDNCHAYEIVARCGKVNKEEKTGKFALLHAIAVASFGMGKIRKTTGYFNKAWWFGSFWNKINLKWKGTTHNYSLWIKTNSYYDKDEDGKDQQIFYRITKLWDDDFFTDEGYYYKKDR